jgi:hypothetical protein
MATPDYEKSVNFAPYWLARANSARADAKLTKDPRIRTHLIGSAEGYERIAQDLTAQTGYSLKSIGRS